MTLRSCTANKLLFFCLFSSTVTSTDILLPASIWCNIVYTRHEKFDGSYICWGNSFLTLKDRGWDSSVGIAMGYVLDGWDLIPVRTRDFFVLRSIHIGSGSQRASYPMDSGGTFHRIKTDVAWTWVLASIQCRLLECWSCMSTPPYVFMA
jgi:hypothetical protein